MADVGQGATMEFVGLGEIDPNSIRIPDQGVTAHDVTKLKDTEKNSIPGRVVDRGELGADLLVDDEGEVRPEMGWSGQVVITYPVPAGMTNPRVDTYEGFIRTVGGHTIEADGVLRYAITFTVNSLISHEDPS
ncbi:MAG: hypothetical protein IT460_15225 [Planctomycetes bacterium]|nr:hypothetical protein [Planctomycetota bacterium]